VPAQSIINSLIVLFLASYDYKIMYHLLLLYYAFFGSVDISTFRTYYVMIETGKKNAISRITTRKMKTRNKITNTHQCVRSVVDRVSEIEENLLTPLLPLD
jgi:hypothetical protein